jgi:hypothetical protein
VQSILPILEWLDGYRRTYRSRRPLVPYPHGCLQSNVASILFACLYIRCKQSLSMSVSQEAKLTLPLQLASRMHEQQPSNCPRAVVSIAALLSGILKDQAEFVFSICTFTN